MSHAQTYCIVGFIKILDSTYACDFQFYFQVIFLKVTADTHTYKQHNIKVVRGNSCLCNVHKTIRTVSLIMH